MIRWVDTQGQQQIVSLHLLFNKNHLTSFSHIVDAVW